VREPFFEARASNEMVSTPLVTGGNETMSVLSEPVWVRRRALSLVEPMETIWAGCLGGLPRGIPRGAAVGGALEIADGIDRVALESLDVHQFDLHIILAEQRAGEQAQ